MIYIEFDLIYAALISNKNQIAASDYLIVNKQMHKVDALLDFRVKTILPR